MKRCIECRAFISACDESLSHNFEAINNDVAVADFHVIDALMYTPSAVLMARWAGIKNELFASKLSLPWWHIFFGS